MEVPEKQAEKELSVQTAQFPVMFIIKWQAYILKNLVPRNEDSVRFGIEH
jgi:hypothetical protein